jgi:hypothetical protein
MPNILFIAPQARSDDDVPFMPSHGARAYDDRPVGIPPKNPDNVYMFYLSVRNGGYFRRQYLTKRGGLSADTVASDLCALARQGDDKYEVGRDLLGINWKAPCHLYIVVDIQGCRFVDDRANERFDPLHFHERKDIPGTNAAFVFDMNAAFYEGDILADNIVGAPTFRCINHFTDEHGKPLDHPRLRTYGFEIRYLSPVGLEIVDPDGQNQGPPG